VKPRGFLELEQVVKSEKNICGNKKRKDDMNKKILSLMVALSLMITTFLPFTKAYAQGLVEYAIILVIVAFNKDTESVELNYLPNPPSQAEPQRPIFSSDITYTIIVTNGGDPACSQTIQAPVETTPGLMNVMTLATNNNHLVVNGQPVGEELDNCFDNADRVSIAVGVPGPRGFDPTVLPAVPLPQFYNVTIVDPNKGTRAASSTIPTGPPLFFPIINPTD
jgi:hypothetical protein